MEGLIDSLTTRELRKILKGRGLSASYKVKAELVTRLKGSLGQKDTEQSIRAELEDDEDSDNFEDSLEMSTPFTFKDVEDALEKFSGEATKPVGEWIQHYEMISKTCGWNEMQMYLYARKLLQGAARKAVEADATVIDYKLLVAKLRDEFEEELSSYEIHRKLRLKKKATTETFLEFFYDMKKIGPKVDERSMVRYIVDGLHEDVSGKAVFYDSKKLDELKAKLKMYESMNKAKLNNNRCRNCGSKSHLQDSCPDQQKGKRCFQCNNFGHMARNCTGNETSKSSDTKAKSVGCITKSIERLDAPLLKLQPVGLGQFKLVKGSN